MDVHGFVEEMSRDIEDASETLCECDPDEPLSMRYCLSQLAIILGKTSRNLREFQRAYARGNPCR